jgi:opacity protein-like surface antigen
MNIKALLAIAGFSAAAGLAGPASAQMSSTIFSSAYLGGSIGQSDLGDLCRGVAGCDDKDNAWKIFGGYQINRTWAVELGYSNLGEASTAAGSAEVTAWDLVGIAAIPVGPVSVYGKLGFARGKVEARGPFGALSDTSTDLTYGIGAQYDFNKQVGIRGEWQRYDFDRAVDVLSLGVVFRLQ